MEKQRTPKIQGDLWISLNTEAPVETFKTSCSVQCLERRWEGARAEAQILEWRSKGRAFPTNAGEQLNDPRPRKKGNGFYMQQNLLKCRKWRKEMHSNPTTSSYIFPCYSNWFKVDGYFLTKWGGGTPKRTQKRTGLGRYLTQWSTSNGNIRTGVRIPGTHGCLFYLFIFFKKRGKHGIAHARKQRQEDPWGSLISQSR